MNEQQKKHLEKLKLSEKNIEIEHTMYNSITETTICIGETFCKNTEITIDNSEDNNHYLSFDALCSFIRILENVRDSKIKKYNL